MVAFIALLIWCFVGYTNAQAECQWSGSGLNGVGRGVTPVYLRCREGSVRWSYPSGALRVLLRLTTAKEFRACIRPAANFAGATIFLESARSLTKIFTPEDASKRIVRCFLSRGGQLALYVEANEPEATFRKQVAEFAYDLQALPKGKGYNPNEECRPCTHHEMIHTFCTTELVARGVMQRVEPIDGTDISEIHLQITKELRKSDFNENDIEPDILGDNNVAVIQIARHCGAKHGVGQIVMMAARKLGRLVVKCAPRWEEWMMVVKRNKELAHCVLDS